MSISSKLEQYMKQHNYTKADIARLANLPYTTVDGIFKKSDDNTKLSTLKKLQLCMGCSLDEIINESYDERYFGTQTQSLDFQNSDELAFMQKFKQLNQKNKTILTEQLEYLLFKQNQEENKKGEAHFA